MQNRREKATVADIKEKWGTANTKREEEAERWLDNYKLYHGYLDVAEHPHKSNIFVPMPWYVHRTFKGPLMQNFFETRPYVVASPRPGNNYENAHYMTLNLDYRLERNKFLFWASNWINETLTYGSAFRGVRWNEEQGGWEPIEDDIFRWWVDPFATTIEDALYVIREYWRNYDYIKRNWTEDRGYRTKNFSEIVPTDEDEAKDKYEVMKRAYTNVGIPKKLTGKSRVKCWDYMEDGRIVTIVNEMVLVREMPDDERELDYPYPFNRKPLVKMDCYPEQKQFYAWGVFDQSHDLFYELNQTENQHIDAKNIQLQPMYEVQRAAGIKPHQRITRPGNWIHSNIQNGITPVKQDLSLFMAHLQEKADLKQEIMNGSGAFIQVGGGEAARKETATHDILFAKAGQGAVNMVRYLVEGGIAELCGLGCQLDQDRMSEELLVAITDDPRAKISINPRMIEGQFDYYCASTGFENREIEKRQFLDMVKILGDTGLLEAVLGGEQLPPKIYYFIEEIMDKFGYKHKDRILGPAPGPERPMQLGGEQAPGPQGMLPGPQEATPNPEMMRVLSGAMQ